MFLRAPAIVAGSTIAAASVLSIVNANAGGALKEPATGIGASRGPLSFCTAQFGARFA